MDKYFKVNEGSQLHTVYFLWKEDKKKIKEAIQEVCKKFGIEAKEYYIRRDRLHIVPTQNDIAKFSDMMTKNDYGVFKKTSEPSKVWVKLVKNIQHFNKPRLFSYIHFHAHEWSENLFDIDGVLYGLLKDVDEVNLPDFVVEIKASEFYKIIEDYEERCKS